MLPIIRLLDRMYQYHAPEPDCIDDIHLMPPHPVMHPHRLFLVGFFIPDFLTGVREKNIFESWFVN